MPIPGLRLGAATSDRVTVPNSASIQDLMPMSVLITARPTSIADHNTFYQKGSAAGASRKNIRLLTTGEIEVTVDRSGADTNYLTSGAAITAGAVVHLLVTIDTAASPIVTVARGTPTQELTPLAMSSSSAGTGTIASDASSSLQIGNNFATDDALIGDIYAMQVVAGVVSLQAARDWARNGYNPLLPGVRGAWDLGACGQSVVLDKSGNGNHGVITGAVVSPYPVGPWPSESRIGRWKRALFPPSSSFLAAWARGSNAIYQPGVC